MSRLSLLSGSAIVACAFAISTSACAQEAQPFDIPPGSLRDGLIRFATQSDQQILFSPDLVGGLQTPGLRGRYVPGAALDRLLAGTGLTWTETRPGVLVLRRGSATTAGVETTEVAEVVVTGSLLKSSGSIASPVVVLDRGALDRRGLGTVAETLTDLPQNYAGTGTPIVQLTSADRSGSNTVVSTGVNLRGLGTASTLVLVNGRRLAGTGYRGEFSDVSALPSGAVERVDVLLDGASALYGADAVAGVVNVILRRSFDGFESRARISAAEGGAEDTILSQLAGRTWSSGSAILSYEYQRMNALSAYDRPYTATGDLRSYGGTDHRNIFSSPGNVVAFDAATASYVSRFAIRPNASRTAQSAADFEAGATNFQLASQGVDLLPEMQRHSLYGRVRQGFGDRLELSGDLRYSRRTYDFQGAGAVGLFSVTRNNPYYVSPNGAASQLIAYSFLNDLGGMKRGGRSESVGATAGGVLQLGGDWSADAYLAFAQERGHVRTLGNIQTRYLNEALGTTADDPNTAFKTSVDGYFNPYGMGTANSRAVLDFIGQGYSRIDDRSRTASANVLFSGSLLTLPGGAVQLALGAQFRKEQFDTTSDVFSSTAAPVITVTPTRERSVNAAFAEARIPLVGGANGRPGVRSLELSLAGRFEEYDDVGSTSNPKLGVVWSPIQDLALRASWGTSFRAPALEQTRAPSAASTTFLNRADGTRALALYLAGGNPDMKPETAETFTFGFDYRPRGRFTVSANYFDTRLTDRIAQPVTENLSGALFDPSLTPFVTLVSPATSASDLALVEAWTKRPEFVNSGMYPSTAFAAIVDARWVNTGDVRVRGFDLSASAPFEAWGGRLVLDGSASYILDYESRTTPTAPVRQVIDLVGYPVSLRSRVGGTWTRGDLGLGAHWSHVADYRDRLGAKIQAWNTVDAQASWSPTQLVTGVRLALSVQNLFDEAPPFYDAASGFGFDPGQASLLGRVVSLQLIRRW